MRKKVVSVMLVSAMVAGCLAGCGGGDSNSSSGGGSGSSGGSSSDTSDGGKVLNIYCWNEEFKSRIEDHYADYEKVDGTHGKIGDTEVVWNITPNENNAYQDNLDTALQNQESASADDKVDIFLVEADYASKYTDSDYTLPISDLGIEDSDLSKQYQYTKDVVTNSDGVLKGVSWQATPAVLFYNRDIAKEVLGSEDPEKVQEYVKDWDTFNETAKTLKKAGYTITSSVNDTYRVYSNNVSSPWVDADKKISIDANIDKWVDDSMELLKAKETDTYDLWSDDWKKGFFPDGKVFCYFGPAWLVNFSMSAKDEGSVANLGRWGATEGPQSFYWGGTWICAAKGTDDSALVKDIMLKLTTDDAVMKEIVEKDDDFANNQTVMEEMKDTDYTSKILGGQNPLPIYCEAVKAVDLSNLSNYDQGCNEEFQKAMKDYFEGKASKEEATETFYKSVEEKYPGLSH